MTTINSLNHRLDKIQASLPKRDAITFTPDLELLESEERERFQAVLDELPALTQNNSKNLSYGEILTIDYWMQLYQALEDNDAIKAAKMKRRINTTLDVLISMFLNLDLSILPSDVYTPSPCITIDNQIYCFSRIGHRDIQGNSIERGRAEERISDMWRWIEYFENML